MVKNIASDGFKLARCLCNFVKIGYRYHRCSGLFGNTHNIIRPACGNGCAPTVSFLRAFNASLVFFKSLFVAAEGLAGCVILFLGGNGKFGGPHLIKVADIGSH